MTDEGTSTGASVVAGRRLRRWARRTDGRLTVLTGVLVVVGVLTGVIAAGDLARRTALSDSIAVHYGPLTVQALDLYHSLADADATSASEFLAGVAAPPALWQGFQSSVAQAASAINNVSQLNESSSNTVSAGAVDNCSAGTTAVPPSPVAARLDLLARDLSVYSGLVQTARVYNRLGLPLGSTYLELASTMMRRDMLPQARALYAEVSAQLATAQDEAAGFPWFAVALVVLLLGALVTAQVVLFRHTRRRINVGLLAATLAAGLASGLLLVASLGAISDARTSATEGTAQVQVLAMARVEALQARADETVVLILQGNGATFETAFAQQSTCLRTQLGRAGSVIAQTDSTTAVHSAAAAYTGWSHAHESARVADDRGDYATAVAMTIGSDRTSTSSLAGQVDQGIGQAINQARGRFDGAVQGARETLSGTTTWFVVLIALTIVGVVGGMWPRIGEYR